MDVKAVILRAAGINCDRETQYALELAGAGAERLHINRIIENPAVLDDCHILVIPGGFSYGDDVAAGRILANQMMHHLKTSVDRFIADGKLVLGICNGFQVLVKAGILPGVSATAGSDEDAADNGQAVTITYNDSGKFEDRWVYLEPHAERCVFIEQGRRIYLPVAHGEGKVVTRDDAALAALEQGGHVAYKYVDADGNEGAYPVNPNGSMAAIAGLTDATGRVMGLMPHPERFVRTTQHPHWTRKRDVDIDGMTIFNNAVAYVRENL